MSPRLIKASTKALPLRLSFSKMSTKALPQALHNQSSKVSPRFAKASTKALPLRPGFSEMSTKALPQAFRCGPLSEACQGVYESSASKAWVCQDVHEGSASGVPTFDCSFGLLHPLAFDLEGCLFLALLSACLVMAGLSKRFIQTFLSSGSCKQFHLGVSSFSCIARRHSS